MGRANRRVVGAAQFANGNRRIGDVSAAQGDVAQQMDGGAGVAVVIVDAKHIA